MKIKKIEIFSTSEKYFRPIPIAVGTHDSRDNVLVKVTSDNGLIGWGEGSPLIPPYSGEVRDQMVDDIVKRIAPDILGIKINNVRDIIKIMDKVHHNKYYFMCTEAAIDIALFDLLGQLKKEPIFNLVRKELGLKKLNIKNMPLLFTNFAVSRNATKKDNKIKEMIKEAEKCIKGGYLAIKIKVGIFKNTDVKSVVDLYTTTHKKYPKKEFYFFADGNQAYETIEEAYNFLKKTKKYIICFEQPFHRNKPILSYKLYQKIKQQKGMSLLITDEGSASIEEVENVLLSNSAGGSLLKMERSGGFSFVIKLMKLLKNYPNFKLAPCSMTETGIGTTANLHSALIVYKYCHPKLGFGFDGPMQVIGDDYKKGKDTIIYKNSEKGWFISKNNLIYYDPTQIFGTGKGLGVIINKKYIDKITKIKTVIYLKNGNVIKEKITKKGRKIKEVVGKQKELLKHPRY